MMLNEFRDMSTSSLGSTATVTSAPTPITIVPSPTSSISITEQLNRARSLFATGKKSYDSASYMSSFQSLQQAVQIQELSLGKYHKETIRSYWQLGRAACRCIDQEVLGVRKRRKIVLQSFQRAARMAEPALGDLEYKTMLQDMRDRYHEAFSHETIRTSGISSSDSCSTSTGDSNSIVDDGAFLGLHCDPVKHMMRLFELERKGDMYMKKSKYRKASIAYCQALQLQDALVGEDSLDGADIRCKLALCFLHTSAIQQARRALQMAYTYFVAQVGTEHPATLGAVARMKKIAMSGTSLRSVTSY